MESLDVRSYRDYRSLLSDQLEQRIGNNPQYSLRAFARDLRIAPQNLSLILKKKKGLSLESAALVSERLNMDPSDARFFCDLVLWVHARGKATRRLAEARVQSSLLPRQRSLEIDAFRVIADWYHFALLELTHTPTFKDDPKWMARRLGISTHEVQQALERLLSLKLLERKKGKLKKTDAFLSTVDEVSSSALRKHARQMLARAGDALDQQSISERDITTMTMAIDPRRLPAAKKMIAAFQQQLMEFLENGERSEVYCFVPSLFRISSQLEGNSNGK